MGAAFLRQVEHRYIKPALMRIWPWRYARYPGISIIYKRNLDGGGTTFGQDFIPFLRSRGMPKQERVFEWCAGPGFIGLSLLAHGMGETLCLADINPAAVETCEQTIRRNKLEGRVAVYQSDNLKSIPPTEQWDLVVSNPPHYPDRGDLRAYDPDWRIHREFFATVGAFLKPGGVIVLQENNQGSTVADFRSMIEESGLDIVFTHDDRPTLTEKSHFYFIGIMRKGDERPAWVANGGGTGKRGNGKA
jgi:predicted RNA methylase